MCVCRWLGRSLSASYNNESTDEPLGGFVGAWRRSADLRAGGDYQEAADAGAGKAEREEQEAWEERHARTRRSRRLQGEKSVDECMSSAACEGGGAGGGDG